MSRNIAMQSSNLENLRLTNVIVIINVIIAHRVLYGCNFRRKRYQWSFPLWVRSRKRYLRYHSIFIVHVKQR